METAANWQSIWLPAATAHLSVVPSARKRIRIPGEDKIDLNKVVSTIPSQSWRKALVQ